MNDLELTEDERKQLITDFETNAFPDFIEDDHEDAWYGYQVGDKMFDLNLWLDDDDCVQCCVHLCQPTGDGNWSTTHISCPLFEENYE